MTQPIKRPIIGVALMLGAMAVLPGIDVIAKILGQEGIPILQVVWARLALGALMTLPFALRIAGPAALWPDRPWYHSIRAAFLVAATFCFFLSLKWLPIADALAIFFVQPLIVTILSALILRETVGPRRWIAVAVGFVGTLIIIRPGIAEVNPGSWLALAAGANLACYFVMTRAISGQAARTSPRPLGRRPGTLVTRCGWRSQDGFVVPRAVDRPRRAFLHSTGPATPSPAGSAGSPSRAEESCESCWPKTMPCSPTACAAPCAARAMPSTMSLTAVRLMPPWPCMTTTYSSWTSACR